MEAKKATERAKSRAFMEVGTSFPFLNRKDRKEERFLGRKKKKKKKKKKRKRKRKKKKRKEKRKSGISSLQTKRKSFTLAVMANLGKRNND